jgi:hypothetical protein
MTEYRVQMKGERGKRKEERGKEEREKDKIAEASLA